MDYEEMVSKIKTEIWDIYYAGIITQEQLEKLLNIWKTKYYDELSYRKMKGKLLVNKLNKEREEIEWTGEKK